MVKKNLRSHPDINNSNRIHTNSNNLLTSNNIRTSNKIHILLNLINSNPTTNNNLRKATTVEINSSRTSSSQAMGLLIRNWNEMSITSVKETDRLSGYMLHREVTAI